MPSVNDQYVYWFSEKENARVPELSECRDQIVKFWKLQEARKLAMAEAESIQKKVNEQRDKKMTEIYPEQALETGAFLVLFL